ncbi:MAG: hypothetical protein LUD68_00055 [Rikenellaceae bacterium]|nr:hypothetical protein [Rikenellaceae bacterium]
MRTDLVTLYYREDPKYIEAFKRQSAALIRSNEALAWRILELCREKGEVVPTDKIQNFPRTDPADLDMYLIDTKIQTLHSLLSQCIQEYYRRKYYF